MSTEPRPRRFDYCQANCTADCGHCKGDPVGALRTQLRKVEAELATARSLLTQARIDEYAERKHRAAVEAERDEARRLLAEHADCDDPACTAEIAKALGRDV